jgi:hypothetical protein
MRTRLAAARCATTSCPGTPCEIDRTGQPIVTCTDYDGIEIRHGAPKRTERGGRPDHFKLIYQADRHGVPVETICAALDKFNETEVEALHRMEAILVDHAVRDKRNAALRDDLEDARARVKLLQDAIENLKCGDLEVVLDLDELAGTASLGVRKTPGTPPRSSVNLCPRFPARSAITARQPVSSHNRSNTSAGPIRWTAILIVASSAAGAPEDRTRLGGGWSFSSHVR